MRAAIIAGGSIDIRERPDPVPGSGQILVRARAAGVNGADLLQLAGRYPPPPGIPADMPGLEMAGEVVGTGAGVSRFSVGDSVMSLVSGAGQAELVVVHEREAMPVPEGITWAVAGAFPEVFVTAHDALFTQAGLRCGERACIHGAAGGVGTAAVQLAAATGAQVVATVRNPEHRRAVADLGRAAGDPSTVAVGPADAADLGPYDVVLELVGAPNLPADLEALAVGGRVVVIGTGAGTRAEIDVSRLMARRARIHGSTLRARSFEEKALVARRVEHNVLPLLGAGRVTVPIAATYPLAEAAAAYDRFAAGAKLGKVVITFGD